MPNGDAVANFSVAVSEKWKNKQTGQQEEHTEWVRCVAFRRTAEVCGQYLKKGSKVFVAGKMKPASGRLRTGRIGTAPRSYSMRCRCSIHGLRRVRQGQGMPHPHKIAHRAIQALLRPILMKTFRSDTMNRRLGDGPPTAPS
jgi:hypothetical protein